MSQPNLQTIRLEHLPPGYEVHIALFRDLQNAEFLQRQLFEGNKDFEYALIDASVIVSKIHVFAAIYRAVNDLVESRLRSRNVHSEIVFSLSPNNNIATSFRTFGITASTKSLVLIKIATPETPEHTPESILAHITSSIQGNSVPFSDEELERTTDLGKVKKIYKLNAGGSKTVKQSVNGVSQVGNLDDRKELEILILGAMALRGAAG